MTPERWEKVRDVLELPLEKRSQFLDDASQNDHSLHSEVESLLSSDESSFGGTVAQKVAERVPNRIARTIFLDALILEHNQCVFDILPAVFLESLSPEMAPVRLRHPQMMGRSFLHLLGKPGATTYVETA